MKIVVCGTQRCGSTMVCEDLQLAGFGRPNEYFLPWKPSANLNWSAELEKIETKATANDCCAFKIMANQLRDIDACFQTFRQPGAHRRFPHLMSYLDEAVWIYVRRLDLVDQAVSHYIAQQTGTYHAIKRASGFIPGKAQLSEKLVSVEVPYDFQSIMREWYAFAQQNLIWEEFFRSNQIAPIALNYEEAATPEGRVSYLDKMSAVVGSELPEDLPARNLVKLPNEYNVQLREQFIEDLFSRV